MAKKAKKLSTEAIIEAVENMTVLELSDLVKALEDKFGVTAAAPMVATAPTAVAPGAVPEAAAEEKTEFDVILKDVGPQKIQVIKVVRAITGLGLRESKETVEGAPTPVRQGVTKEEAESVRGQLEEVGAVVEIK
ncbi:MAG: 50S ribosomal protein L7/L12 [Anaerolineae bacterium]